MTTFAGGMTPAQFYTRLNGLKRWYNVKTDYGAEGDGVTDDTVAIQTAINTASAAGGGNIYFPNGIYIIAGALQRDVGGIDYKSQLYIPQTTIWANRVCISLIGETSPNFAQSWGIGDGTDREPIKGVILRSTLISSTAYSYVIANNGTWGSGPFNYDQCNIDNIQIQITPDGSNRLTLGGIGFANAQNAEIKNVTVFPYNLSLTASGIPQNNCVGIAMPKVNCEDMNVLQNISVGGFETGLLLGEHTSLDNVIARCCKYGYQFTNNNHTVRAGKLMSWWNINDLYFSALAHVKISQLQIERSIGSKWYDNDYTILDASNYGHGEVSYNIVSGGSFDNSTFSKSGGANLQCYPITIALSSFTITGSKEGNVALESLISALVARGIIIDSTT